MRNTLRVGERHIRVMCGAVCLLSLYSDCYEHFQHSVKVSQSVLAAKPLLGLVTGRNSCIELQSTLCQSCGFISDESEILHVLQRTSQNHATSVSQSVRPSVSQSGGQSVRQSVSPSVRPSVSQAGSQSSVIHSVRPSVSQSVSSPWRRTPGGYSNRNFQRLRLHSIAISRSSSYRTVNTLRLGYKNQ